MSRRWLACAIAQLWLAGCGHELSYNNGIDVDGGGTDDSPSVNAGFPCDIQTFLGDNCQRCHATHPLNGAPMSLMTYADLTGKNAAGFVIAQRALARIKNVSAQMPPLPAPAATPAEISMLEAWVAAGTPSGECFSKPGPFDGPPVCTSGTYWTLGNEKSPRMHPGRACITCHAQDSDAPRFQIAGTAYPTGHEPNECNGATNAVVEVTDANGIVIMLPVNAAGNFFTTSAIAFPIRVAVLANGKRRSMPISPPNGDCNSCHTQSGANGAPGRIALP